MAHVRLGRTNDDRFGGFGKDFAQRPDLNRIAQGRAGAMGFDIANLGRIDPTIGQRLANHLLLRDAAGRGQTTAPAIMINGRAANEGQNFVAIGHGIGQPLEDNHATPFPAAIAISRRRKGLATTIGRQEVPFGKSHAQMGREHQVHTTGQSEPALMAA